MYAKAIAINNLEQKVIWGLLGMAVGLVLFYIYLVNSSVFNILQVRTTEDKISQLSSQVADLEASYIQLSSNLDLNLAHQMGFVDATSYTAYAYRGDSSVSGLSYRNR